VKLGDLVSITEQRGAGSFYKETDLGTGLVLSIEKSDSLYWLEATGPINLGDNVTVMLSDGSVKTFLDRSLKVI